MFNILLLKRVYLKLHIVYSCHTLAFVPSRGRVYAFGLGGSGQLGTKVTSNSNTPQLVKGPWVSVSNGTSVEKAAPKPELDSAIDVNDEEMHDPNSLDERTSPLPAADMAVFVWKIFCGGDQSFVLARPSDVSLLLFRYLISLSLILVLLDQIGIGGLSWTTRVYPDIDSWSRTDQETSIVKRRSYCRSRSNPVLR